MLGVNQKIFNGKITFGIKVAKHLQNHFLFLISEITTIKSC